MLERKKPFVRPTESNLQLHNGSETLHKTFCTYCSYIQNELRPTTDVRPRQHADTGVCHGLIVMFAFDILQLRSGCQQICSVCFALPSLTTGLAESWMERPHGGTCCSSDSGSFPTFVEIKWSLLFELHVHRFWCNYWQQGFTLTFGHITLINLFLVADMADKF
jgi:hypothetical protein